MGRTGLSWLRVDPLAGFCEHDDERLGCIKKAGYF
jgi:hypothetical protein